MLLLLPDCISYHCKLCELFFNEVIKNYNILHTNHRVNVNLWAWHFKTKCIRNVSHIFDMDILVAELCH